MSKWTVVSGGGYKGGGGAAAPGGGNVTEIGALTVDLPVFGGGTVFVKSGTKTGNTNALVTQSGAATSGAPLLYDASGNAISGTKTGNTTKLVTAAAGAATVGYVLLYDATGNAVASQPRGSTTVPQLADSTSNPANGSLASFDGSGNINDSGVAASSVITSVTTTGTSGAASVTGHVLNIPNYATGGGGSGALTQIAQQVLGSAVASVTFSAIAGTYSNLFVEVIVRGSQATTFVNLLIQFNSDTGNNYQSTEHFVSGGAGGQNQQTAQSSIGVGDFPGSTVTANAPGVFSIRIPGYAQTTFHKGVIAHNFFMGGTSQQAIFTGGGWANTAAITDIKLLASAGNFVIGSIFTLYGLS